MDEFFRQQATFKDPVALSWWPNRLYELGLLKGISKGQPVSPAMVSIAKKLRRDMTPEEHLFWAAVRAIGCAGCTSAGSKSSAPMYSISFVRPQIWRSSSTALLIY